MKLTELYKLTSATIQLSDNDLLLISDYNNGLVESKAASFKNIKQYLSDSFIYKTNGLVDQTINFSVNSFINFQNKPIFYLDSSSALVIQGLDYNSIKFKTNSDVIINSNGSVSASYFLSEAQPVSDNYLVNKAYVDSKLTDLTNVFTFKGSVATSSQLPTKNNKAGYVYLVQEDNSEYVWISSSKQWQKLGSDKNQYFEDQLKQKQKLIDTLSATITGLTSTISELTGKIKALSGQFDNYLRIN